MALVSAARRAECDGVEWDVDEDVRWVVDGPVVMFDSAWPGTELDPDNHLLIDLNPNRYRVRATYRADGDNWMILVQLQPFHELARTKVDAGLIGHPDLIGSCQPAAVQDHSSSGWRVSTLRI
jgi:Immunity protein 21